MVAHNKMVRVTLVPLSPRVGFNVLTTASMDVLKTASMDFSTSVSHMIDDETRLSLSSP